jgi:uncharacterized Zn finger protein (UPF0148 family)
MKQIVCEMCGGKELIKQDGTFTCQSCGTKYSVEEAKKMMVTIDTSAKKENALKNARRAMENKNYEKAKEYFNIVQMEEPENWEANFYILYPYYALQNKSTTKNILKDIKKLDDNTQQNEAIKQISTDLMKQILDNSILESKKIKQINTDFNIDYKLKNWDVSLYEEILGTFVNELVSEFGKNEFTTSIKTQCDKTLLKVKIQRYEAILRRENDIITVNKGILSKLNILKDNEVEENFAAAKEYADELVKISPTSYELTRFNEIKKSERRFWIIVGITALIWLFIFASR